MDLPLSPEILALLKCPRTKQALHLASSEELKTWHPLDETAEGFLVSEDGAIAYPIDEGFPILLLERALTSTASPPSDIDEPKFVVPPSGGHDGTG